jgi:hydroxyacylglutathione hydrolase
MRVETFALGPFETNSYLLIDEPTSTAWIIDVPFEPEVLIQAIQHSRCSVSHIIFTHAHADHIGGVRDILQQLPTRPKLLIHSAESSWLVDPMLNLSALMGLPVTTPAADYLLNHGDTLSLGPTRFEIRHTPGHSPGSISLITSLSPGKPVVFAGDALFAGSIGRTDFPGCSQDVLLASIRRELYTLEDHTVVYPGHGPPTTIGREKRSNPYARD